MARTLGLLGLAGFALIALGGLIEPLWDMPGTEASGEEVLAYVAANRSGFIATLLMYVVGMSLFLAFCAGLWAWLRRAGASEPLAAAFALGAVSLVTVVFAGFAVCLVLAYRVDDLSADTARLLYDLCFALLNLSGAPTAVALAAFCALVLRGRHLPSVVGWLAGIAAAAHVLILASFIPESGFLSLTGGVIWAVPATMFAWFAATSAALVRAD
jgi:hypothetical protein